MTSRAKGMLMALVLLLVLAGGIGLSLWLSGGEPASLLASKAFAKSGEILKNPVMGFAPEADYLEAAADNTLVYVDVSWRELEPSEGVFAFEAIEKANHLDEWRAAGKHVVFRFVCDLPGDEPHRDIPDWLYEKTKDGKDYDISYGKGYSPNYANRVFIEAHAKAVAALGKRFGQDTFFSYVELGSLGHWGEWHVKYEDGLPRMPGEAVRRQYIAPYLTAFPHAKILMRRPFVDAKKENFGLFNDMAGDRESTEEWLDWIANGGDYAQAGETDALVAMPSVWETAPVGGEFTSRYSFAELLGPRLQETAALVRRSHTTFLGPKCPHGFSESGGAGLKDGAGEILKNLGYRLRVREAAIVDSASEAELAVELQWVNDGAAPLYWDWPACLYILSDSGKVLSRTPVDIRLSALTENKEIRTRTTVEAALRSRPGVKLCVGVEDPFTGGPAVYLAMDAPRLDTLSVLFDGAAEAIGRPSPSR